MIPSVFIFLSYLNESIFEVIKFFLFFKNELNYVLIFQKPVAK